NPTAIKRLVVPTVTGAKNLSGSTIRKWPTPTPNAMARKIQTVRNRSRKDIFFASESDISEISLGAASRGSGDVRLDLFPGFAVLVDRWNVLGAVSQAGELTGQENVRLFRQSVNAPVSILRDLDQTSLAEIAEMPGSL